jgi:adenylate kinase
VTIFLAGAHAVGKTYLAERTGARAGLHHVTASQLIREERGCATWTEDRRVRDADANQEALIRAVLRRSSTQPLLLDGHFVLRGDDGRLIRLAVEVFAGLRVSATVLVEAPCEVVAERLAKRHRTKVELSAIRELSAAERDHACYVCSVLGLPLVSVTAPNEDEFEGVLRNLVSNARVRR